MGTCLLKSAPAWALVLGFFTCHVAAAAEADRAIPRLPYETSAYERAPWIPRDPAPWARADLVRTLGERAAREKQRHELDVYYYRIGHTLAFPLPVARRPTLAELPPGIGTIKYPWLIWLAWELEERWRVLHYAWRQQRDRAAGALLQRELAALAGWEKFHEMNDQVGLALAHLAGCLAIALSDTQGWDADSLRQARAAADAMIERDVWPWFQKQWGADPTASARLHNIPVITLARAAQLARVSGSPRTAALDEKMAAVLRSWCRFRMGPDKHTEGTAYDGFQLDSVTEWLAGLPESGPDGTPGQKVLLNETRDAFRSVAHQWIHYTLPGRADLHVPLGDVEPEMPFWCNALARMARWHDWPDAGWLLSRVPVSRLPAAAIVAVLDDTAVFERGAVSTPPATGIKEHPNAATLRTGWTSRDVLATVSLPRTTMGHLHADAGHVILGWQGRFWITDPGYQQYRPGEERTYTLAPEAHNCPVIAGEAQSVRLAGLEKLETTAAGWLHVGADLSRCYKKLPAGATVQRDVWLVSGAAPALVVRDTFAGLKAGTDIGTHWLGGDHLAWAFVKGWARLSDGRRALWIGSPGAEIPARALNRQPGSRGPLTLSHSAALPTGNGVRWWVFWRDEKGGWTPPSAELAEGAVKLKAPDGTAPITIGN